MAQVDVARPLPVLLSPKECPIQTAELTSTGKPGVCTAKVDEEEGEEETSRKKDAQFWLIFLAMAVVSMLSALEASVIATALPTIVVALDGGSLYVWFVTAYLVASTAFLPLWGQLADIFGRKYMLLGAIVLFALGSAISGAAQTSAMLIVGRTVQGVGGGGILALVEIVVSDITTLRERGKFVGMIGSVWCLGTITGPVIGGACASSGRWRWIFFLNLPFCLAAFLLVLIFLRVNQPVRDIRRQLWQIDYCGTVLFCASLVSLQIALSWGGVTHSWSSFKTLLPLVCGLCGLVVFCLYESRVARPIVSPSLFNRTSTTGFVLTCVHGIVLYGFIYMFPVYLEGVRDTSAVRAGVLSFPSTFIIAPFAIVAGIVMAITGRYKWLNAMAFVTMALGLGLFVLVKYDSPAGFYIGFQILFAPGAGVLFTATLPAIQVALSPNQVAEATSVYSFFRNFGAILGLAITTAVFNLRMNTLTSALPADLHDVLKDGGAYSLASSQSLQRLGPYEVTVKVMYTDALRTIWIILCALSAVGGLIALCYREIPLRTVNESKYGLSGADAKGTGLEKDRTASV